MFKNIIKRVNLIAILLLAVLSFTGCENKKVILTTDFEETEVMRIGTSSTYMPEMMLYLTTVENQYREIYGEEIFEANLGGVSLEDRIKDMVLAKVAEIKVMNLMAAEYGIEPDSEKQAEIKESSKEFYSSLTDKEKEALNITQKDVNDIYTEYVTAKLVYEYIIRDINPEISDDEARTVTVMHILIKTYVEDSMGNRVEYTDKAKENAYETALLIREKAVSEDGDFESLILEYSDDEEMTYSFMRGEMAQNFEEAAFNLDEGEISEVIETEAGYHIIKLIKSIDKEETQKNKEYILQERKDGVFKETYDTFAEKIMKNLNEELFDSIHLINDPEVKTKILFEVDL